MKWFTKRSQRPNLPVKATFAGWPIRSEYVLNRLRNTKWEDRKTILDLIRLERYVLEGPKGWIDAMGSGALKQEYEDAVDAIEAECLPPEELAPLQKDRADTKRHVEDAKVAKEALFAT